MLSAVLAVVFAAYLAYRWFTAPTYKLRHIPAVGRSGVITSYIDAIRYFTHAQELLQEGYQKYRGTAFRVPTMSKWQVVVTGPDMINDIRKATDDQLSFIEAVNDVIQGDYTMGPSVSLEPYHVGVIRSPLTKNLAVRFDDVKDEIITAFGEHIPPSKDWTSLPALPTTMKVVCRSSNRLFVGLPLCRNLEYRTLNEEFTIDVMIAASIINLFPVFLKPLVGRLCTKVSGSITRAMSLVGPVIQERFDKIAEYGSDDYPDKPNDLLSWLIDEANPKQRDIRDLTLRLLTVNFAAIHTTTMAFTNVLFDLAMHPEYVPALREEVESVIDNDGWTKVSMGKMRKLDSFIKESHRFSVGGLAVARITAKEFIFSNGTTVPAGTFVGVPTVSTHLDEDNYEDAQQFKGFRFADRREGDGEGTKHQMVALTTDYITFGSGRHACPGRFFAVNELKAMLAHVLMTYDVKMPDGTQERPKDVWFQSARSPNPKAEVLFRRRI